MSVTSAPVDEAAWPARRVYYRSLALRGILVVGVGLVLYTIVGSIAGDPLAPLFVAPLLLTAVMAVLVRRTERALGGLLVMGVAVVVSYPLIDPVRLLHPNSFIDFVPALFAFIGSATAALGAATSLLARRRGSTRSPSPAERWAVGTATVLIAALATFSLASTLRSKPGVAASSGDALVIRAERSNFAPREFRWTGTGPVRVLVRNNDWIAHSFAVRELDFDVYIGPRSERLVELTPPGPGRYAISCEVTGHERMRAALEVRGER